MKVVWKRPDGFINSQPSDFEVFNLDNQYNIWLHRTNHEHFPFRVSGGWKDSDLTHILNRSVNLLKGSDAEYLEYLNEVYNHDTPAVREEFFQNHLKLFQDFRDNLKGDTWEVDIMGLCLAKICQRLKNLKESFLSLS